MREMQHATCSIKAGYALTFAAEDIRGEQQNWQINADLQRRKFKNSDPTPTRPW